MEWWDLTLTTKWRQRATSLGAFFSTYKSGGQSAACLSLCLHYLHHTATAWHRRVSHHAATVTPSSLLYFYWDTKGVTFKVNIHNAWEILENKDKKWQMFTPDKLNYIIISIMHHASGLCAEGCTPCSHNFHVCINVRWCPGHYRHCSQPCTCLHVCVLVRSELYIWVKEFFSPVMIFYIL